MKQLTDEDIVNINLRELRKHVKLPEGMYLGLSSKYLDTVNVFREDRSLFKEYVLEDWNTETLEELAWEIAEDLDEKNFKK